MALSDQRWKRVSESPFPWEREALDYIRTNLPDQPPYFGWTNFTFIDETSTVGLNEVDCLVITPHGVFLIEIKSDPGILRGDRGTWIFEHPDGRIKTIDNPLIFANVKAKKLKALLMRQPELRKHPGPPIFIEPLIWLSHPDLKVCLPETDRTGLCWRSKNEKPGDYKPGNIIAAIKYHQGAGLSSNSPPRIDSAISARIIRAMDSAGIRPSERLRHVGDYRMEEFLGEGPHTAWQDWSAKHVSLKNDYRRVRIYPKATSESDARLSRSMAEREYHILRSLRHPGILEAQTFHDHDLGPAILFSRDPDELRLDFYLDRFKDTLPLDRRLDLIRQLAEAVRYAHSRRVIHRALSPQSVLITRPASERPVAKIFNWQAGRDLETSTSQRQTSVSVHLSDYLENASYVYLSPEALVDDRNRSEVSDIFSLGAIAFHILAGQPPAPNVHELQRLLQEHHGLPLPAVLDSAAKELDGLVRAATNPDISLRLSTVSEFLDLLESAEDRLTAPALPENPLEASKEQLIYPGITIKKRLGAGGTAAAFLVSTNGKTCVLKIALKPDYNDRIRSEFEVLQELRHDQIVAPIGNAPFEIQSLAAFLMEYAGDRTLAGYLRENGRVSLELLHRFGSDLLEILRVLERKGIPHRDLKPDNMAVFPAGPQKEAHLRLFDFSLSRHRYDDFLAGTAEYREPFLITRKLWDPHADRYSATLILYEMATGTLPKFGDGRTAPHVSADEATIDSNLIESTVRDSLTFFFRRALKRDPAQRFESASDMVLTWDNIFREAEATPSRQPDPGETARAIESVTLESPISHLSLGTRAENILDRENIFTVSQLLATLIPRIRALHGVGATTRKDIVAALKQLRRRFPEPAVPARSAAATPGTVANWSIDDVLASLLPKATPRNQVEIDVISRLLGLSGDSAWPSQADISRSCDCHATQVSKIVSKFRVRWREDSPTLTRIRNLIAETIAAYDGFVEVSELVTALVAARGSSSEEPLRTIRTAAVIRAATEAERSLSFEKQRFTDNRLKLPSGGVLFTNPAKPFPLSWVEQVATTARDLANTDPLPSPSRVLDSLRAINLPGELAAPPDARILRLAAGLSGTALSPRLELYPKGLSAAVAVRLSSAALATPAGEPLTADEIQARVRDRYPEAELLPASPALDQLLKDAGIDLARDPNGTTYRPSQSTAATTSVYPSRVPLSHRDVLSADRERDLDEAERLDRTLAASLRERGFLVLTAIPKLMLSAIDEIQARFGTEVANLDHILLTSMRRFADEKGVDWTRVLTADAEPENHPDRRKLEHLVSAVIPMIERDLIARSAPLLLICPGLLASYNQVGLVEHLRDNPGPAARWLLVASSAKDQRPTIDSRPVPVFSRAQWASLSPFWIKQHPRAELVAQT